MLSKHFSREEFECPDCTFNTVDYELLVVLERIRERYGAVTITSGCRCTARNESVGGAKFSQHLLGKAADFWVDANLDEVVAWLNDEYQGLYGIGLYSNWIHVDVRSDGGKRWVK